MTANLASGLARKRAALCLVLLLALLSFCEPLRADDAALAKGRVVAIGDVHGDLDALVAILQQARLVDASRRWSGRDATLVQLGDIVDRGPKVREAMDFLMELEKQAPRQGGRVVVLLGNHEVMNISGDLRDVTPANYASFARRNAEKRRRSAYRAYVDWQERWVQSGRPLPSLFKQMTEAEWVAAHPVGYFEQRDAYGPRSKYGRWLRERPTVVKLGDTIFVHAGLSPALSALPLEAINQRVWEELKAFDAVKQHLLDRKLILPFFDLEQITAVAQTELDAARAEVARRTAEATQAGKTYEPEPDERIHIDILQDFLTYPTWFSFHADGPLWFRGLAMWSEEEGAPQVTKLLETYAAANFVLGHTTVNGHIVSRYGGKVFLIDTGMLSSYYQGGQASAIEVHAGRVTAIYMDGRSVLLERAGGSLVAPETSEGTLDLLGGGVAEQAQEPGQATQAAQQRVWIGADGKPLPFKSDEELLEFLRTARVVRMRAIGQGITLPRKALLEKDGIQVNAAFRDINDERDIAKMAGGGVEFFFRDSYIFECAAYQLSLLLGLDNVPPATERRVHGTSGSVQIWIENAMTEGTRQERKIRPPDVMRWNRQVQVMRIFDNLIHNTDRNAGNILITPDWKLWMIDHTRAFRRSEDLREPGGIVQCERGLWDKLRALDKETLREHLKKYLRSYEIDTILKRRDKLVQLIQKLINERGEDAVLFTFD